jgi:metal-sulfur cluster biosynthetic enzyme
MSELERQVEKVVGELLDPETGLTFAEMHLIQSVKEVEPGAVQVDFIPSSPYCPIAIRLAMDIKRRAKNVPGVKKAIVNCHGHIMEESINKTVNQG